MSSTSLDPKILSTVWIYGFRESDKFNYFSIQLPDSLKRRATNEFWRREGKAIQPKVLEDQNVYGCKAVAIDGVVYVVGGGNGAGNMQSYIQHLDTTRENTRWIKKSIIRARSGAGVADLDGKIYIFGGDDLDRPSSEVFDTLNGTAEMLPEGFSDDMQLVGVDRNLQRIMFLKDVELADRTFVFYDTVNKTWTREEHRILEPFTKSILLQSIECGVCVVVGTTIYWLAHKVMMAYDFDKCEYYESKILTDPSLSFGSFEPTYIESSFLLHINQDYFCLVWDHGRDDSYNYSLLYFTILRVSRITTTKSLAVSVLDTEKCSIAGVAFYLSAALRLTDSPMDTTDDTELGPEDDTEVGPEDDTEVGPEDSVMREVSSDSPPPLADSTISQLFEGVSIWVYGYFGQDKLCWFPIELSKSEVSRDVKRRRICDEYLSQSSGDKKEMKIIDPVVVNPGIVKTAHATIGGIIYIIGGIKPYISETNDSESLPPQPRPYIRKPQPYVQCYDTATKTLTGKRYEMNKGRVNAQVAELDGKIYIFGGDDDDLISAEVFDPVTGSFEMLPDGYLGFYRLVGVDRKLQRIVFLSTYSKLSLIVRERACEEFCPMLFYNTEKKTWTTNKKTNVPSYDKMGFTALVGTTIYWFSKGNSKFMSYDFEKNVFRSSVSIRHIKGYPHVWEKQRPECQDQWLFHVYGDDIFCVVTMERAYEVTEVERIFCTILRISNSSISNSRPERDKLDVDVLDTDTYFICNGPNLKDRGALRM